MTNLPVHPYTKLTAIGLRRDGSPIWPVMGGSEPAVSPTQTPPAATVVTPPSPPPASTEPKPTEPKAGDPPKDGKPADKPDEPLGEAGKKALQEEREARKELEKQVKALAPLAKIAEALGADPKDPAKTGPEQVAERVAALEKRAVEAELARWRAEVANEKGLTVEQASRLLGATKEELSADAAALKALFPTAPGTPRPDPSQGARGAGIDVDAQIAEAQKKGDWKTVLRLQNQKLANK